ncbi:EF-P beta-lysylation protein EpmB [Ectothiorhodospiraceae bacterium WFHF3C12]|nr:EF-P beta-lysylation protein EpmB [Ectothiorhodospiraceae bacterium WFHF3C12]
MTEPPARPDWRQQLANAIQDPVTLLRRLSLSEDLLPGARAGEPLFALRVPEAFAARMRPGDPDDPLLRQVLPLAAERQDPPGYTADPLAEVDRGGTPGLIEKYHARSLLVTTGACAINCRYCFRRHFPYHRERGDGGRWDAALARIAADVETTEVILSGGDPLVLDDERLGALCRRIAAIGHVSRLRIHTRLPVVIPDRVDDRLTAWLRETRLQTVVVLHCNHPAEVDDAVRSASSRLREAGVTLLNQAVLLAGVNDDPDTLCALSERLFSAGVLPYYLHLLDPVSGAAHFDVPEQRARRLLEKVAARLPGYLVPRLAREEPGRPNKTVLAPDSHVDADFVQNAR